MFNFPIQCASTQLLISVLSSSQTQGIQGFKWQKIKWINDDQLSWHVRFDAKVKRKKLKLTKMLKSTRCKYGLTNGCQTLFFLSFNTIPLLLRVFPKPSTNYQDHFAHNTGPGNKIICGSLMTYWLNTVKFPTNTNTSKNAQIQSFTIYFVKKTVIPLKCFNTFHQIVQNMVLNSSLALSA